MRPVVRRSRLAGLLAVAALVGPLAVAVPLALLLRGGAGGARAGSRGGEPVFFVKKGKLLGGGVELLVKPGLLCGEALGQLEGGFGVNNNFSGA